MSTISAKRSADIAASTRMSPVGLPIPTSIADTVAPAWRAKLRIVERPSAKAANIAAVTFGSRALTFAAAATP